MLEALLDPEAFALRLLVAFREFLQDFIADRVPGAMTLFP